MKKNFKWQSWLMSGMFACFLILAAGSEAPEDSTEVDTSGIPSDELATVAPPVKPEENTTLIPNISYNVERIGDDAIVKIDMTGIQAAESMDWLKLFGTTDGGNQNVWVSIDDKPKGILVYNVEEGEGEKAICDVVFVVDNSGTMSEEADVIANDIDAYAKWLASRVDAKFGLVGFDGCIHGAINMTDVKSLSAYLNRSGYNGTSRTMGYAGLDAAALEAESYNYPRYCQDECGGVAIRYADANFDFRPGANRVYIYFTDEPNQPFRMEDYSVEYFKNVWTAKQGTVHTVYSAGGDRDYNEKWGWWEPLYNEKPWLIADYTGGTAYFTDRSFTGINLQNLPVSGAMMHSYIIRFRIIGGLFDGLEHSVKITVYSKDGMTKAVREFKIKFE